jgi:hypothetical protein
MRATISEFAAGNFTPETQFPEDHVAWTDPGNPREQQGNRGNVKQPVNLINAGQPDTQGDKGCHEYKQHSNRAHVNVLLYDAVLVEGVCCVDMQPCRPLPARAWTHNVAGHGHLRHLRQFRVMSKQ